MSHEYYVIGQRVSGERLVLSTCISRECADWAAERMRQHLEGYDAITVEENAESKSHRSQPEPA